MRRKGSGYERISVLLFLTNKIVQSQKDLKEKSKLFLTLLLLENEQSAYIVVGNLSPDF